MSRPATDALRLRQARRLGRHLIGVEPSPEECARWCRALEVAAAPLERPRDLRLWDLAMRWPLTLGPIDAGLAFLDPYSPVRQRVCLMLAVLEASPAHLDRFEARPMGPWAWAGFVLRGCFAAARAALGLVLVLTWGVLWR